MFEFLKRKTWPVNAISRMKEGERYSDCWSTYPRTGKVTDSDIAAFVKKHTHWWDRLDYHFVSDCVLEATNILSGYVETPKGKWFFGKNYYGFWIEDDKWIAEHKEFPHKDFQPEGEAASVRYQ